MKTSTDIEREQIERIEQALDLTADHLAAIRFFDVEASSLEVGSFPVEVADCGLDMAVESRLIRPLPSWTEWSASAEANHGISREMLQAKGVSAAEAADFLADRFTGRLVFSDAPEFDNGWSAKLFADTGRPMRWQARDYDALQLPCQKIALETMGIAEMNRLERKVEIVYLHTHRAGADVTKLAAGLRYLVDREWREWFAATDYADLVRGLGREPERRWIVEEAKARFEAAKAADGSIPGEPFKP